MVTTELLGRGTNLALCTLCCWLTWGAETTAQWLQCPAYEESLCLPGRVNGLIACGTSEGFVEYSSVSEYCVSCHDGSMAAGRETCLQRPYRRDCHPVEVDYPHESRRFKILPSRDEGARLTSGKVTCESCHSGEDPSRSYVFEGQAGAFCLDCHNK